MSLSREDVQRVAELARLGLSEDEITAMQESLSSILDHVEVLNELNTDAIAPTAQVIAMSNVYRADEVGESLAQDQIMDMAPDHRDGFFAVPAVMGGDEGGSA